MAQPYVGEIRMFAGNFAPAGWMFCEGQLLPISEYETLFNLIGTTYGGDGQSTFALPDLRGRIPIHLGNGFTLAETGGAETVTLTVQPDSDRTATRLSLRPISPIRQIRAPVWWQGRLRRTFSSTPTLPSRCRTSSWATPAASQPHNNFQPYLCVDFIISLFGIFPSQT